MLLEAAQRMPYHRKPTLHLHESLAHSKHICQMPWEGALLLDSPSPLGMPAVPSTILHGGTICLGFYIRTDSQLGFGEGSGEPLISKSGVLTAKVWVSHHVVHLLKMLVLVSLSTLGLERKSLRIGYWDLHP